MTRSITQHLAKWRCAARCITFIGDSSHGYVNKTPIVPVLYQSYDFFFFWHMHGIGNEACRVWTSFLEVNAHHKEPLEKVNFAQDWYLSNSSFYCLMSFYFGGEGRGNDQCTSSKHSLAMDLTNTKEFRYKDQNILFADWKLSRLYRFVTSTRLPDRAMYSQSLAVIWKRQAVTSLAKY